MSWQTVKLGEAIRHRKGFITISDDKEYKLCRVQLHRRGVLLRGITNGTAIRTKKQQLCKANDFIVAEMDAKVGGYGFIPEGLDGAIVSSHYYLFEVNEDLLKREFLTVLSKSLVLQNQIKAIGSTNYARVSPKDVLAWEIPLPSIEEQERIVENIQIVESRINQIITELSHQLELVRQLRQAFLREAMQGKLVEQDYTDEPAANLLKRIKAEKEKLVAEKKIKKEKPLPEIKAEEIPFEIPSNWTWIRLGSVCDLITSGSRDWAKYYANNGAFFVRMGNLSKNSFNLRMNQIQYVNPPKNSEGNRTRLEENDILVSITGDVGNLGLIPKDLGEAYINQHTALVRLNNKIVPRYIAFSFLSKLLQDQFNAPQRGLKNSFRLSDIDFLIVPLPPLAEQKRIVEKLEKLMAFCDELEANIRESKTQAETLLQVALKEALEPKDNQSFESYAA